MTETILIIGGTGNIGFPLIKLLAQDDQIHLVAGAHDLAKDQAQYGDLPVELRHFDFLDAAPFDQTLAGVDRVFFVRPPQLAKPKQDMLPFLNQVKAHQIKQTVFVSMIGVEKNPVTPHHKIESMIVSLGLPHTFIRPSFFMQNLSTTHREDICRRNDLFIPAGNAKTSFIDTADIAAVAAKVLTSPAVPEQKLNITGPEAITYAQVAQTMSAILGRPITYSKPSLLKFRKTMLQRGVKKDFVNVMVMLYLITQMGNAKQITQDLPNYLGRPAHSVAEFITANQRLFAPAK
ncbi:MULTISPECIES: NmrA family NAD(P)-binding protein [unclassified Lacticaseibacillus]|uniref:NmrA family NAD(P)-binding protein n=1 Tax=unclassified Lacticaseibacillus TaxID=2759744 RepID=UPI0019448F59|nr:MULTISPECIES: NmrA family NAD(P)-binding protein [unclassified Lacticaseibacillus]